MTSISDSLNWVLEHWYYWAIILLTIVLFKFFQEMKRLKEMYSHWTEDRKKQKTKNESTTNPSVKWKWLVKEKKRFGTKYKILGRIRGFKVIEVTEKAKYKKSKDSKKRIVVKPAKTVDVITISAETRILPMVGIPAGNRQIFMMNKKDVRMEANTNRIIVPYNLYWNEHPSGEMMLIGSDTKITYGYAQREINLELKKLAIDGFASQMMSFSATKPTWGHEDQQKQKELDAKTLGFGKFLKRKEKPYESDE